MGTGSPGIVTASRAPYGLDDTVPPAIPPLNSSKTPLFQYKSATILVPLDNGTVIPLVVLVIQPDGTTYNSAAVYPATVFGTQVGVYTFTPAEFGWWQIQTYPNGAVQNEYQFYVHKTKIRIPFAVALVSLPSGTGSDNIPAGVP